ncbi:PAS domain-containing protein [Hymenobacter norwichensis]|uniref:PAS domain-containing protein n=1 Tax=Hymenobacter norwichensis TaxID=223903 RepID=UPI0003B69F37|nr:PAS domain-containing protein [Hymenobacter norwichensis]
MTHYEQRIKELEQELQATRAMAATAKHQLDTLAKFLPAGILLYNDEGIVTVVNEQVGELLGISESTQQWIGKRSADIVPTVRASMLGASTLDAFIQNSWASTNKSASAEFTVRNGRTVQIDYIPINASEYGERTSRLICLRDVTERKSNARLLNEQREFYETILDFLPGEAAAYDVDHRYRYVNAKSITDPALRAWMIGKTDAEYVAYRNRSPELAIRRRQYIEEALAKGQVVWEESFRMPDGSMRYMLRHLHAIQGENQQPRMLIGYGTDITQRYKTEERIRALFAALPDTILVIDASGQVQNAKLGDTALLLPETDLVGALVKDVLPAAALRSLLPCLAQVRSTGQPGACTFELPAENTFVSFHAARVMPLPDAQAVLIILQNVTTQELVRRELADKQEFIRQVIDVSPTLIHVRDANNKVVLSNQAFNDFMRPNAHMSIIQGLEENTDAAVGQEVERIYRVHAHVMATGEDVHYEAAFTQRDGQVRWLQSMKRPFVSPDGTMNVLSISTDITEVKRARMELENSEKKFRDLVQYSQALICTHDLEGNMLSVNPATERMLNRSAQYLVGRNLREVVPAKHQANLSSYLTAFAEQSEQRDVMAIMTRQGKRYLQYNNYLVKEQGQSPYVVASAYDITESVLTERVLRQAKLEVEESAQAKDNFLASMSHEIRTPLNGVLGMAALLAKTELDTAQRDLLDTMNQSGHHLLAVVNDVLDMAKITAGQLQLEHIPFNLWDSVKSVVQSMSSMAEEKELYLSVVPLAISSPMVLGDSRRLNQVLLNLLSNALKFTEHGSVTVGADVLEQTAEAVRLRLWVRDTGIGIPEQEQQRIFGIFTQASTDISRRFGGTGLGLSISQQLVQLMGGTLTVDSKPGQGSTFAFTLQLPRTSTQPLPTLAETEWPELAGLRVLLAEDNRINQRISLLMLQPQGVAVDCASSGPEALRCFNEQLYDVVLMDIQMPGMSGVEVTRLIRHHPDPRRANIPIIALTANALRRDQDRYLAAGMNACLIKPFEERYLHQTIINVLRGTPPPAVSPVTKAPAATPSLTTPYDLNFLQASANGNPHFTDRMLSVFVQETPATVLALRQAIAAEDWRTVRQLAHSVKPVVVLLRIEGGADAIKVLENQRAGIAATKVAAHTLAKQLELTCETLQKELRPQ